MRADRAGAESDASSSGRARLQRLGRPFDRSRDAEILAAALDELAEHDYDQVGLDAVAARSGRAKTTLYRRWPTKLDLVLAAVRAVGRPPEADVLPDTGSLRADLLAVTDSAWLGGPERRLAVLAGLTSAARSSPQLAEVVRTEITEPYVEVYAALLRRAVERGEVAADTAPRVALLAQVIPALSSYWLGTSREPVRRELFVAAVDDLLLPALRG